MVLFFDSNSSMISLHYINNSFKIRRRLGVGTKLVEHLEDWCKQKGAKYAYIATDCTNEPSINLFTKKFGYSKFRTLTKLVQPVHSHYKPVNSSIAAVRLPPSLAMTIYNQLLANSEFHPEDIESILSNKLNFGTFMAIPKRYLTRWDPKTGIIPPNFAMLSVWNTKEVFRLQVKGVSPLAHALCAGTRILDSWVPCLRLPSFPDVFKPFGVYFLYGLHMEGKNSRLLTRSLCGFVHNVARDDDGCGAVVTELGQRDPLERWSHIGGSSHGLRTCGASRNWKNVSHLIGSCPGHLHQQFLLIPVTFEKIFAPRDFQ